MEAFCTTYTEYYRQSGSEEPIEQWLRLKSGASLENWLSLVFDEEYAECLAGNKHFIYLCDASGVLLGWLSHSSLSENGEIFLSQYSLEANHRNRRITTQIFEKIFQENLFLKLFPNVKEIKLITRKINRIAQHLYTQAGFSTDETIDPSVYGDSYDERYLGFRLHLPHKSF